MTASTTHRQGWVRPRKTWTRVSRIAFVMIVVLLALILLTRIGQAITRWDGVDLDLYRRAARE